MNVKGKLTLGYADIGIDLIEILFFIKSVQFKGDVCQIIKDMVYGLL